MENGSEVQFLQMMQFQQNFVKQVTFQIACLEWTSGRFKSASTKMKKPFKVSKQRSSNFQAMTSQTHTLALMEVLIRDPM